MGLHGESLSHSIKRRLQQKGNFKKNYAICLEVLHTHSECQA